MKRSVCFLIMFIVLCTCPTSFAESISPTAYIEQPTIQPTATRSIYLNNEIQVLYTCPVKKNDVFVTFHSSETPTSAKVKILTLDPIDGSWDEASDWEVIMLGETVPFNLTQSARYRIWVAKAEQLHPNGNCTFYISASP